MCGERFYFNRYHFLTLHVKKYHLKAVEIKKRCLRGNFKCFLPLERKMIKMSTTPRLSVNRSAIGNNCHKKTHKHISKNVTNLIY